MKSGAYDAEFGKASGLKRKMGALTVLLLIYLCGYGVLIVGALCTGICLAGAACCKVDAGGRQFERNCGDSEFKHFIKGYMILN